MLLKNGWASHGNVSIQTSNTCSFDSLYFAFAAPYADYGHVKEQIDQLAPDCAFSKMVATMCESFATNVTKHNSLHRQRNVILHSIFKSDELEFDCGLIFVDCAANVNYTIPKVLPTELYSYSRKKQCDRCGKKTISKRCFIDINFEEFEKRSIKQLNTCLLDTLISEQPSTCPCDGSQIFADTEFSNIIMIDLHLESTIKPITLNAIPKKLNIMGIGFALTGCIEFIGEMPKDFSSQKNNGYAHYISHVLRSNGRWQTFDDLKARISKPKTNVKIKGQVLFYVKTIEEA